jgi:Putative prokaryotic signal transducing protein
MTVTRESLLQKYQLLTDDELRALFESGELSDLAREVAAAELRQRGIDLSTPVAESRATGEAEFVSDDLVPIARFFTAMEAHMLQSRLEADGVPAIVADANIVQANALLTMAVGGVRVLVPEAYLNQALETVKAIERGDYALDDQANIK